jgi:hypothetical protein
MRRDLECTCDREIPINAVWTALVVGKPLRCKSCGERTTSDDLIAIVDVEDASDRARSAIVACIQLKRYGWTSCDSIANVVSVDPHVAGGLLAGLVRAGLIQRVESTPTSMAALFVQPQKPIFEPGPTFPVVPSK